MNEEDDSPSPPDLMDGSILGKRPVICRCWVLPGGPVAAVADGEGDGGFFQRRQHVADVAECTLFEFLEQLGSSM